MSWRASPGGDVYTQVRWLKKKRNNHKDGSGKMAVRITQRGSSALPSLYLARGFTGNAAVANPRQLSAAPSEVRRTSSALLRSPFSTTRTVARNGSGGQSDKSFTAVATGGYEYPGIPHFTDPYAKRQWQLEHMAGAFRVFARMGFTEGASGHISVRDPVDRDTFWINPYVVTREKGSTSCDMLTVFLEWVFISVS